MSAFFIIIVILTSIFFQDLSRVWMAASQQHMVDNQPSAFSHHKAVVYPWECWNEFLVSRCPSFLTSTSWDHGRDVRWNLETSSAEVEFRLCTDYVDFLYDNKIRLSTSSLLSIILKYLNVCLHYKNDVEMFCFRYMEPGVIAILGGVLPFGSIFIEMCV